MCFLLARRWDRLLQLDRKQQLILLLLAGVILFGGGYRYAQVKERAANEAKPTVESMAQQEEDAIKEIQVHIVGAVERPGVYKLLQDARTIDAVQLAGLKEDADTDSLRLAAPVQDGQTIMVPVKASSLESPAAGEQSTSASGQPAAGSVSNLVNINTANADQLETLPGIGPALAQRIIQHRETNGFFYSVEDIKSVSGIGEKKYADLKDKITIY